MVNALLFEMEQPRPRKCRCGAKVEPDCICADEMRDREIDTEPESDCSENCCPGC